MYPSVLSRFSEFTTGLEGSIPYMYDDIKGLVTVGVGNLVDPVAEAQKLPFQFKHKAAAHQTVKGVPGARATRDQIAAEWQRVKDSFKNEGHGNIYSAHHYAKLTDLELSPEAMDALVESRLLGNESILRKWSEFADFLLWPADAQLGLLSLSWALGPYKSHHAGIGRFKAFRAACAKQDFDTAAAHCHLRTTGNPGVIKRNTADVLLFRNAARVIEGEKTAGYNRATLYYPMVLSPAAPAPLKG